jgi:hypothetical protein
MSKKNQTKTNSQKSTSSTFSGKGQAPYARVAGTSKHINNQKGFLIHHMKN